MPNDTQNAIVQFITPSVDTLRLIAESEITAHFDLGAGDVYMVESEGKSLIIFQTSADQSFVLPRDLLVKLL